TAAEQRSQRRQQLLLHVEGIFAGLDHDIRRVQHGFETRIALAFYDLAYPLDLIDQGARYILIEPILIAHRFGQFRHGDDDWRIDDLLARPEQCDEADDCEDDRYVVLERVERRVALRQQQPP